MGQFYEMWILSQDFYYIFKVLRERKREKGRNWHVFEPQSDPVMVSHNQEANSGLCDITFCALAATEYNNTHTAHPRLQSTSASTSHWLFRIIFMPKKHESDWQGSDPSYAI